MTQTPDGGPIEATQAWKSVCERYATEPEWLEARKSGIGASEVASIFGCGYANTSPITVWAGKIGGPQIELDAAALRRMRRGKKMEPIIASEFEDETGLVAVDPNFGGYAIFRSSETPWLFATLDRFTIHPEHGPIPVELKAVRWQFHGEWDQECEPPLKFQVQCQSQMYATGTSRCYLVGLIGGDEPVIRLIERNQRFIDAMIVRLAEFWGYVERREMPPVDESEATRAILGMIYPSDTGAEISLPEEFVEMDRELLEIKDQIKTLETRKDGIENRIKAAIGDATKGVLPVGSYTWKEQSRTTIDAELLRAELPDIAEQFSKTSSFRVLRRSNK